MTTFIDKDSGAEYKSLDSTAFESATDGTLLVYAIRPVKVEPKWEVRVADDLWEGGDKAIEIVLGKIPKDQAQLIKEAIKSVMEYINGEDDRIDDFKLDKARQSMRENN